MDRGQPNIVIMVSDDTGWNDVGYHGSEIKTPTLDRLAREGIELDRFYVCPTCSPTRASLLMGRPPSRFNILGPIGGRSRLALPEGTVTLPELLRRKGYQTAITGKWHLGLRPEVGPRKYGFDYTYGYFHGQIDQYTHMYKNGERTWHRNDEFVDEEGHATDLIVGEAIRFIKEQRNDSKPFFLYVPFSVPHYPLQEEEKWVNMYKDTIDNDSRRIFAASMTHMDDGIGRILTTLEEEKLAENTLIIFASDNGGQKQWTPTTEYGGKFKPNDRLGDNRPLRGWKGELYEGGIRVPAVMYWPGRLKSHKDTHVLGVQDIYPTLAHLIGASIPSDMNVEGINVWPTLSKGAQTGERILYWRTHSAQAVRREDWKLIHHGRLLTEGQYELFNMAEDPLEKRDLMKENPGIFSNLKGELMKQLARDPV